MTFPTSSGNKQSFIHNATGKQWFVVGSSNASTVVLESYGTIGVNKWPLSQADFAANFTENPNLPKPSLLLPQFPILGYSVRLLNKSYTGSSAYIRRSSDNALQDIGFVNQFSFDTGSFNSFVGGHSGYAARLYHQFGSSYLSAAVKSRQPLITTGSFSNNRTSVIYDGSNDYVFNNSLASSFSGVDSSFGLVVVVVPVAVPSNNSIIAIRNSSNSLPWIGLRHLSNGDLIVANRDDTGTNNQSTIGSWSAGQPQIVAVSYANGVLNCVVDGVLSSATLTVLGQRTLNTFAVSCSLLGSPAAFANVNVPECWAFNSSIGLDGLQKLSFNLNQYYKVY